MKTIQAVELRKNLGSYLKRASMGEKFKVSYRGKSPAVLSPYEDYTVVPPNSVALFAAAAKIRASLTDENRQKLEKLTNRQRDDLRLEYLKDKYGV